MYKLVCFLALIVVVSAAPAAKPGLVAAAYTAPVVAAPAAYVTATSSQVIARNYNGLAAPIVAAPALAAYTAPIAYTAPAAAYTYPAAYAAAAPFYL